MSDLNSGIPKFPSRHIQAPEIMPPIKPVAVEIAEGNYASEFHKRLVSMINDFDGDLDDEHEVGIRLVSFGQTVVFHLQRLGFWNPSLISFSGETEAGEHVQLIQHVTQISILLMKLKRIDTSKPKRKIGFGPVSEEVET